MSFKKTNPTASLLSNVTKIYSNVEKSTGQLQLLIVSLVRQAVDMSKKDILSTDGDVGQTLEYLFKNTPSGIDRGTLSAWFVEFTPIRPKFNKQSGHYEGLSFARTPEWNIEGATETRWYDVNPERTRDLKKPQADKVFAAMLKQVARLVAADDSMDVTDALLAITMMAEGADSQLSELVASESVQQWAGEYKAQEAAKQAV